MIERQKIIQHLKEYPLYSQDGKGYDANVKIIIRVLGTGAYWYITEGSEENDDFIMYGYAHIQVGELGYISLNELLNLDGVVLNVEFLNDNTKLSDLLDIDT